MSAKCELCVNSTTQQHSQRVFPCLYHCKKNLCIQHLSEHEKLVDIQINCQQTLQQIWNDYSMKFNEKEVIEQFEKIKTKLADFQKLKEEVQQLVAVRQYADYETNLKRLQTAIVAVHIVIDEENRLETKNQSAQVEVEFEQSNDDESSLPSMPTDCDSETTDCSTNDHLSTNDECSEHNNEYADPLASIGMEFDNDDDDDDLEEDQENIPLIDQTNIFPFRRRMSASQVRGVCPLTHDGAFGINSVHHGIRLCSSQISLFPRTCILHRHFLRIHRFTSAASLKLARAIGAGADPFTTKLFNDNDKIFNIDDLRTIKCPVQKPFISYPNIQIPNMPCNTIKQLRELREHLKKDHRFSTSATNTIMKSVKNNLPIHLIIFPRWISIVTN